MNSEILLQFNALCKDAKRASDQLGSAIEFEPYFIRVLDFIHAHPSVFPQFKETFLQMLSDRNSSSWELIAFCMHDLHWPEIKTAAHEQLMKASDHRVKSVMADVIAAHSDSWEDACMYSYYSTGKR